MRAMRAMRAIRAFQSPNTGTPRQPRVDRRNSNPRRGDWSRHAPLNSMTHEDEGGCRTYTGPAHRTAHTTTTTSIAMVPKTVGRILGSTIPPRLPPEGNQPAHQSTTRYSNSNPRRGNWSRPILSG